MNDRQKCFQGSDLMTIEPLKDDVAEWAAKSWWRGLLACLFRDDVLERRLKQQLKDRPNVWGVGLWPDDEHEEVAKVCAEALEYAYDCERKFIPSDPINMIDNLDGCHDLCGHEAVVCIESDLNCTVPDSVLRDCTFGELVDAVLKVRGTRTRDGLSVCDGRLAQEEEVYAPKGLWGLVYGRLGLFSWLFALLAVEIALAVVLRLCGLQYVRAITAFVSSVVFVFYGNYRKVLSDVRSAVGFAVLTICLANVIFWYVRIEAIAEWVKGLF